MENKSIVIIDDNFIIRQVLSVSIKSLIDSKIHGTKSSIYTSNNGIEGLGFIYVTGPQLIIIDSTLPKYSGREVIDFLITNAKYTDPQILVIVLEQEDINEHKFLPPNFFTISKQDKHVVAKILNLVAVHFNTSQIDSPNRKFRVAQIIGKHIMSRSNKADIAILKSDRSRWIKGRLYYLSWVFLQFYISFIYTLFYLIFGQFSDQNIDQKTMDYREARVRFYPTLATLFTSILIVAIQLILFVAGGITILNSRVESLFALNADEVSINLSQSNYDQTKIESKQGKLQLISKSVNNINTFPVGNYAIEFEQHIKYSRLKYIYEESSFNSFHTSLDPKPLSGFTQKNFGAANLSYQLSPNQGADWYFFDGQKWTITQAAWQTSNTIQEINANLKSFNQLAGKTLAIKIFFQSNGKSQLSLNKLTVDRDLDIITSVKKQTNNIHTDIVVPAKILITDYQPIILNASWANGQKIIAGRIDLPKGTTLDKQELENTLVKVFYTTNTNHLKSATKKQALIGASSIHKITINNHAQYVFELRKNEMAGGYVAAEVIYKENGQTSEVQYNSHLTSPKHNSTFTVSEGGDQNDVNPGDGICDHDVGTIGSQCTLRAALTEANALLGTDDIFFNIPNTDPGYNDNGTVGDTSDDYWTIAPASALPIITESVQIDGSTQPGSDCSNLNLAIELNGNNQAFKALEVRANNSSIVGLIINRFNSNAIHLNQGVDNNIIQCNILGLNKNGDTAQANGGHQIYINDTAGSPIGTYSNIQIGGTLITERNVISGTAFYAIYASPINDSFIQGNYLGTDITGQTAILNTGAIYLANGSQNNLIGGSTVVLGSTCSGSCNLIAGNATANYNFYIGDNATNNNIVRGNFIGTDIDGQSSMLNFSDGISIIGADNNLIEDNLISGNSENGVLVSITGSWTSSSNTIQNNYIGTNADATLIIANGRNGVQVGSGLSTGSSNNNQIINNIITGSDSSGILIRRVASGNLISQNQLYQNGQSGIRLTTASTSVSQAYFTQNSIFDNSFLGIDLVGGTEDGNGVSANDVLDGDSGVNNLQNYPILSSVSQNGPDLDIFGTFNSLANSTFRIEFYSSSDYDHANYGEGETYIGYTDITTDVNGDFDFSVVPITLSGVTIYPSDPYITAIATYCSASDPGPICTAFTVSSEFSNYYVVLTFPTDTPTPTPTRTPQPNNTFTPTPTRSVTPTPSNTPKRTATPTPTPIFTLTITPTIEISITPTEIPILSTTPTLIVTPTVTVDPTIAFLNGVNNPDNIIITITPSTKPASSVIFGLDSLPDTGEVIAAITEDLAPTVLITLPAAGSVGALVSGYPGLALYALPWVKKRKKQTPWGIVYNSKTFECVPFAILKIYSDDKFLDQTVSDLYGKFSFNLLKGNYKLLVDHAEFQPFILDLVVNIDNIAVTQDIAMVPRENAKKGWSDSLIVFRRFVRKNWDKFNSLLFVIGIIYSVIITYLFPTLFNIVVLTIYFAIITYLILTYSKTTLSQMGQVINEQTQMPLAGVFIKIFDHKSKRQIDVLLSNSQGQFYKLLDPGSYLITAYKAGFLFPGKTQSNLVSTDTGENFILVNIASIHELNITIYLTQLASNSKTTSKAFNSLSN